MLIASKQCSLRAALLMLTFDIFKNVLLFERTPSVSSNDTSYENIQAICVYRDLCTKEDDDVIGCDDENCLCVWLYLQCITLIHFPTVFFSCTFF